MLALTALTIWLRWEQAFGGGSGFAGSMLVAVECSLSPPCHSGFAGIKLLAVDQALLVAVDQALLGASW